jgi:hypothetical protein
LLYVRTMHSWLRAPRSSSLRRYTISKLWALCLVLLIVSPFSAPFKTVDLASSHGDSSPGNLPKDKVNSDEDFVGPPDATLVLPALTIVVVAPFLRPSQLEEQPLSSTVLRL